MLVSLRDGPTASGNDGLLRKSPLLQCWGRGHPQFLPCQDQAHPVVGAHACHQDPVLHDHAFQLTLAQANHLRLIVNVVLAVAVAFVEKLLQPEAHVVVVQDWEPGLIHVLGLPQKSSPEFPSLLPC